MALKNVVFFLVILWGYVYCDMNDMCLGNDDITNLKNEVKSLRKEMTKYKDIVNVLLKVRTRE